MNPLVLVTFLATAAPETATQAPGAGPGSVPAKVLAAEGKAPLKGERGARPPAGTPVAVPPAGAPSVPPAAAPSSAPAGAAVAPPGPSKTAAPTDAEVRLAKELVVAAQKAFSEGRFADAASRFERAYSVKPVPAILYNLARCYEKLKDTPRALRGFRDYLRQEPNAPDRKKVETAILALEKKLRAQGLSQLIVLTEPPKARVKVDGKDIGESPASVELVKGPHDVTLVLEGYKPVDRVLDIKLEASSLMSVQLEALPPPPPPKLLPPPPPVQSPALDLVEKRRPPNPVPGAIAGGAALVGAGVGTYFGLSAEATAKTLRTGNQTGAERDVLYDRAVEQANVANVAFAVAGGAAVTAVVLFLVNR